MLKKNISTSRRFAELKSDTARMLYILLLPHLDVKGRYSGDPLVIKGQVAPRLRDLTEKKVKECLDDMKQVGLIKLYGYDGDMCLDYRKFSDFQKLRPSREAESEYPSADEVPQGTPIQLPNNSHTTPAQVKLREDKLREDKLINKRAQLAEKNPNSINKIFDVFYKNINPTINYGNKTSRNAADFLIKKFGLDKAIKLTEYACSVQGKIFAPIITTPYNLKEKLAVLKIYTDKEKIKRDDNKIQIL